MRNPSFGLDGLKSIGQHNFPAAFHLVIVNICTVISNRKLRLLRPLLHTLPATMYPPSSQSFPSPYSLSPLLIRIDASSCILRAARATSNSTRPPNARDQMQQVHSSPLPHPIPNLIPGASSLHSFQLDAAMDALNFFTTRQWVFDCAST